nr:single insulin-like growth factor-binding domain protein-2 [Cherax quadricarinatus]
MNSFTLFCLLSLAVASCSGLKCRVCDTAEWCQDPSTLNCTYGTVKDACNCCDVCGQGPGEVCGGPWDIKGRCGVGLKCQKKKNNEGICIVQRGKI